MKIKQILVGVMFGLSASLSCAAPVLSPVEATNKCVPPSVWYNHTGHLATTYLVSLYAGQGMMNTLTLSYFSQYPDENKQYDAIVNAIKNKTPLAGDSFTMDVVTKLHSLHGGGSEIIKQRRVALSKAIEKNMKNPNDVWKAGLLIHALGDAYAHTKNEYDSDNEKAFGPEIGHLIHSIIGEDPDQITLLENQKKYLAYTDDLFKLLKTNNASESDFNAFKSKVTKSSCKDDKCLKDDLLRQNDQLIHYFTTCMNKEMKPLTKQQVQNVMDQIK